MQTSDKTEYKKYIVEVIGKIEGEPDGAKVKVIGTVIVGLCYALPFVRPFFMDESKSIEECITFLNEKLGELWNIIPDESDMDCISDSIFEYYGINEKTLEGCIS